MDEPKYVFDAKRYFREYYLKNREKKLAYAKSRQLIVNEQRRQKRLEKGPLLIDRRNIKASSHSEYNRKYHAEVIAEKRLREKIRALQIVSKTADPKCEECGVSDIRILCINHINGGGRKEHAKLTPNKFRASILDGTRETSDLNVLCCNCNIKYEYSRGRLRLPSDWEDVIKGEIANHVVPK